jgi:hypothetical protein
MTSQDAIKCRVPGCTADATVEALVYDVYRNGSVFEEPDMDCPCMCEAHRAENEAKAVGPRTPRNVTSYPYTNRRGAQGYTVYRKLHDA